MADSVDVRLSKDLEDVLNSVKSYLLTPDAAKNTAKDLHDEAHRQADREVQTRLEKAPKNAQEHLEWYGALLRRLTDIYTRIINEITATPSEAHHVENADPKNNAQHAASLTAIRGRLIPANPENGDAAAGKIRKLFAIDEKL